MKIIKLLKTSIILLIIFIIISFIFVGCGSRKVNKHSEKEEVKTEEISVVKNYFTTETKTDSIASIKSLITDLGFRIEPLDNEAVSFKLLYNGSIVEGKATGKVYITNRNEVKTEEIQKVGYTVQKENIEEKTVVKQSEKREIKDKASEKEEPLTPYFLLAGVLVVLWFIMKNKT